MVKCYTKRKQTSWQVVVASNPPWPRSVKMQTGTLRAPRQSSKSNYWYKNNKFIKEMSENIIKWL